jgi:hypothetical protein
VPVSVNEARVGATSAPVGLPLGFELQRGLQVGTP